jgi:hypothetical protein
VVSKVKGVKAFCLKRLQQEKPSGTRRKGRRSPVTGLLVECKFNQARERFSEACFWRKALWRSAMVEQVKKKKPGKRFGVKISEVAQKVEEEGLLKRQF